MEYHAPGTTVSKCNKISWTWDGSSLSKRKNIKHVVYLSVGGAGPNEICEHGEVNI